MSSWDYQELGFLPSCDVHNVQSFVTRTEVKYGAQETLKGVITMFF